MSVRTYSQQKLSSVVYNRAKAFISGSVAFDGTGDYLTVGDNAVMEFGGSNLTWEFWMKTTTSDQYDTILARTPANLIAGAFILLVNNASSTSGELSLYMGDYSVGTPLITTSGVSVRDGAWHHIAVVRNANAWAIYIDGTSRGSKSWSGSITDVSGDVYVAKDQSYTREFSGNLSNLRMVKGVAVYTTTFTPPTTPLTAISGTSLLTCQRSAGTISDSSINGLTVTTFGNAAATSTNPFT
jgi:hypothetical protein